ncbi:DUF3422 family protein [Craterilacuibacter sp.]|uniref:DUF3422 family protein n=1 Tax=Craterilacuibacter sp. TaxID=2870909 RepID=UPI003F344D0A
MTAPHAPCPILPHPLRRMLNDEAHARPPAAIQSPARLSTLTLFFEQDNGQQRAALAALCALLELPVPAAHATHYQGHGGTLTLRWSLHTEFARYTVIQSGSGAGGFADTALDALPAPWLTQLPGVALVAIHALLLADDGSLPTLPREIAARWFDGHELIGSRIGDGNGTAYTDLRLHPDSRLPGGFSRFVVIDHAMGPRQSGRMLQRLFEIEAYRMLALLALPLAKNQMPQLDTLGLALRGITAKMNHHGADDRELLAELSRLSAEVENLVAQSQYRFSAALAYQQLVERRISELREHRLEGLQPFCEFMAHRLAPAMDTCTTISARQDRLTARLQRATALLRTRVEVAGEEQNRALLASMDRRAELQLRLQQTVEGLSVGVLTYYAVGLVAYASKALKAAGVHLNAELVTGASIPLVALAVWWGVHRAKRALEQC